MATSLFSREGTGIAGEATGTLPVIIEDELVEATVVMEVGLFLPGLVVVWLLVVGDGGCCFFLTASLKHTEHIPSVAGLP